VLIRTSTLNSHLLTPNSLYLLVPAGKFGIFVLGILGASPAGLGISPGVGSGILGTPELVLGNLVLLPGLAVGLPILGSIGLILELDTGAVLVGVAGLTGILFGGRLVSGWGTPVAGSVVAAGVTVFFLTAPVRVGLVAGTRVFFLRRPRFVSIDTVFT
jgi:hypothetical protein